MISEGLIVKYLKRWQNLLGRLNLERIDKLIKRRGTGTPLELAERLDISKASLYRVIDVMKEFGAPIEYCNLTQSYVYTRGVTFYCGFYADEMKKQELQTVNGGFSIFEKLTKYYSQSQKVRLVFSNIAFVRFQITPMDVLAKQFNRDAGCRQHKINYLTNLNFVKVKDLNELGVQEMDALEMRETDGGIIPLLIVAAVVADKVVDNYDKGYAEGNK